jgi:hypothetical protein
MLMFGTIRSSPDSSIFDGRHDRRIVGRTPRSDRVIGFPIQLFSSNPHLRVIQALAAHDTFHAARFETAGDEGEES